MFVPSKRGIPQAPPGPSILRPSAGTSGRNAVVRMEEWKTGDLVEGIFAETEITESDGSIGLDYKERWNIVKPVGGRYPIGVFVDEKIETNAILPGEGEGFIRIILGNAPERPGRLP